MNDAKVAALEKRLEAVEARMAAIEKNPEVYTTNECLRAIAEKYPVSMNKTEAAEVLNVTRTTIYAMLADGRLTQVGMGKVSTMSLIQLLKSPPVPKRRPKKAR